MKEKISLTDIGKEELFRRIYLGNFHKNSIFNFLNSHSVYLFKKHKNFRNSILKRNNINLIDGFMISLFLSITNFKAIKRLKGPDFSDSLLRNANLIKNMKQLFIGFFSDNDIKRVLEKYPLLEEKNCFFYNVPFLKKEKFNDSELIKLIKKFKPNYVWVAIGNPKQEILSNDLAEKVNVDFFFNVGAFFDYAKNIKKQSPKFFQVIGFEWLYRLTTDFSHTWNKVKRSFIANRYLFNSVGVKEVK
jgi:N-acetylglucosaminyldiphosphoundecaprenol N-acetyl-beta-D-mannosaminyltransferase